MLKLRALSMKNIPVEFTLEDCPVIIYDNIIALSNRKKSPLLKASTIARGTGDFFEFDFVYRENLFLGFVTYFNGFKIYDPTTKELSPINNNESYIFKSRNIDISKELSSMPRTKLAFKSGNTRFNIYKIVKASKDCTMLSLKESYKIQTSSIKICTGIIKDNEELAFGETYNGGVVVLHDFIPMLEKDSEYLRLEDL